MRTIEERRLGPVRSAKRLFLGKPLATRKLSHQRLGKPTALAIFASDALSSTSYATEEILRQLVPVVGLLAFSYSMPIAATVVLVLTIILFSYRQTLKAYPAAASAYLVTKDNFGIFTAQIAGVALLTDYILTVAVSISAGVTAITSAFPGIFPLKVPIAVLFVALIAWGNLRGVKESGRLFATPTYVYISAMFVLVGYGLIRFAVGDLAPVGIEPVPGVGGHGGGGPDEFLQAAGIFLILKAFSSGCAAATGVEAISDGVPAFKPPEWKNARTTLGILIAILGSIFMGLTILATKLQIIPDHEEKVTVVAMITREVFGDTGFGNAFFYFVQFATMMILVLAANTAFADFPRLANFAASDRFLPRQFTKRGHRLVFSNGVIFLSAAAIVLIVAFGASVTSLIPLYAVGVFLSFTLSQSGMARRHFRVRQPHWQLSMAINATGAAVTAVVCVVFAVTKFSHGAWAILVAFPTLIYLLYRFNAQYKRELRELEEGMREPAKAEWLVSLVMVEEIDSKLLNALEFAKTIASDEIHCVHVATDYRRAALLKTEWDESGPDMELRLIECRGGDVPETMAEYAKGFASPERAVTIITPGPFKMSWWTRIKKGRTGYRLTSALREYPNVNVVVVRDHPGHFHQATFSGTSGRINVQARPGHNAVILVDRLDRSTLRAIRFAKATDPLTIRCLHAGVDPDIANDLLDRWVEFGLDVPIEVIRCEDRDVALAVSTYLDRLSHPRIATSVILPRRDYPRRWHRLLHDRTSRGIARELYRRRNLYVIAVPYYVEPGARGTRMGEREDSGDTGKDARVEVEVA